MLVGLTSQAVTSGGGFGAAFLAFGVAAFTVIALMFTLSFLVATAQQQTVDAMRLSSRTLKRWGGAILVIIGAWFLLLAFIPHPFTHIFHV